MCKLVGGVLCVFGCRFETHTSFINRECVSSNRLIRMKLGRDTECAQDRGQDEKLTCIRAVYYCESLVDRLLAVRR